MQSYCGGINQTKKQKIMGLFIGMGTGRRGGVGELSDYYYGIEWDVNSADPACVRIGRQEYHATLPLHVKMRRCVQRDDRTVAYYLHPMDSTRKEDGSPAKLDGTDGQVMVEIPRHWRRFETEAEKRRAMFAQKRLPGFTEIPTQYISAYEASLHRPSGKLSSVVNANADYRGGNNSATNDTNSASLLGRPVSQINLTGLRAAARARDENWNCNTYDAQTTLHWLMAVEYANMNCQLAYNPQLTTEGWKQGGLGDGVTDLVSAKWNAFNGYMPFVPCGYTNSLGNMTGVKAYEMPAEYDEVPFTTYVPSYRGIENPFGHIWKITDGCKCRIMSEEEGGLSEFYVCTDPANYQDTDYTGYEYRGLLPRANTYVKELIFGQHGDMMPNVGGASATTYWSDYFYASIPDTGESQRAVFFGGYSDYGANAGVRAAITNYSAASASAYHGSRLCNNGV